MPNEIDCLNAITMCKERYGREPDVLVVNVTPGSKLFGVDLL